jgi:hypothetical protein
MITVFVGCNSMKNGDCLMFQKNISAPSSGLRGMLSKKPAEADCLLFNPEDGGNMLL